MRTWPRVTSTCASDQVVPTAKRIGGNLVGPGEDKTRAEKSAEALAQHHLGRDDRRGGEDHRAATPDGDARDRGHASPEHTHATLPMRARAPARTGPSPNVSGQLALAARPYFLPTSSVHLAAQASPQRLAQPCSTTSFSALSRTLRSDSDGLTSLSLPGGPTEHLPPCRSCRRRLPRSRPRSSSRTCPRAP